MRFLQESCRVYLADDTMRVMQYRIDSGSMGRLIFISTVRMLCAGL